MGPLSYAKFGPHREGVDTGAPKLENFVLKSWFYDDFFSPPDKSLAWKSTPYNKENVQWMVKE